MPCFRFTPLDYTNVNWTELNNFQDRHIGQTKEWLDFIKESQEANPIIIAIHDNNFLIGYFSGMIIKRYGFKILGSPIPGWSTSYMGVNLHKDVDIPRGLIYEHLINFCFKEIEVSHFEFMDRNLVGDEISVSNMQVSFNNSFEINLIPEEEEIFKNMRQDCRTFIRQSARRGVTIELASDDEFARDYFEQLSDVFAKQGLVPTYSLARVKCLIKHIGPSGNLLLLRARDDSGKCIATGIFPAYNKTMFTWGCASFREDQFKRPNEILHWEAIKYWKERGINTFDMNGGGEYKRKFGGYRISIPWYAVSKSGYLIKLRNSAKQFYGFKQKILGKISSI